MNIDCSFFSACKMRKTPNSSVLEWCSIIKTQVTSHFQGQRLVWTTLLNSGNYSCFQVLPVHCTSVCNNNNPIFVCTFDFLLRGQNKVDKMDIMAWFYHLLVVRSGTSHIIFLRPWFFICNMKIIRPQVCWENCM